ncbi:MAG: hypothetical protein AAF420_10615 [Pseudomonadota bacterium]
MFRFIRALTFMGFGLSLAWSTVSHAALNSVSAETTLTSYIVALKSGDTGGLGALMTDELRNRHSALLNNTQYGGMLVSIYGDASFTIDSIEENGDDRATGHILFQTENGQAQRLTIALVSIDGGDSYQIEKIN